MEKMTMYIPYNKYKTPKTLTILTNLDCNLNCSYCYECKNDRINDIESIKRFIKSYYINLFGKDKNAEKNKKDIQLFIEFLGGESLLYPDMLNTICELALDLHKYYQVETPFILNTTTNATLINNRKQLDFIKKWKDYLHIGISIDGTKEIHDRCRIDILGRGSYDRAVEGFNTLKTILKPCQYGVKATFTHETINNYAEGVINLINLGFTDIAANVIFEEQWNLENDAITISNQLFNVVDYLFDNNLEDTVHIFQLNNSEIDMLKYKAESGAKDRNFCGACSHMICLGMDNLVYGCQRFCTMNKPIPIGYLSNTDIVITTDGNDFINEVTKQYELYPDECKKCKYGQQCPSCSAIPYEYDNKNPSRFLELKGQCGYTYALVSARLYYKYRLMLKKGLIKA